MGLCSKHKTNKIDQILSEMDSKCDVWRCDRQARMGVAWHLKGTFSQVFHNLKIRPRSFRGVNLAELNPHLRSCVDWESYLTCVSVRWGKLRLQNATNHKRLSDVSK